MTNEPLSYLSPLFKKRGKLGFWLSAPAGVEKGATTPLGTFLHVPHNSVVMCCLIVIRIIA